MKFSQLITIGLLCLLVVAPTRAADLYRDGAPRDSDMDGLTDQGETQIFLTDPNNRDSDRDSFLDGTEVLVSTNPRDAKDPQITAPTVLTSSTPWPWYFARASGIIGYLLLFLLTLSGVGITTGYLFNLFGPIIGWRIHRTIGITLIVSIVIHLLALYLDKFINFSFADLLIPFHSGYKTIYLSLGIIGLYLFIVITLTSLILIVSKYKFWRLLHYLTFPTFVALFIHGVFIGTDSSTLVMQIVYWSTGISVALAFIYRLLKIPALRSRPLPKIVDQISDTTISQN